MPSESPSLQQVLQDPQLNEQFRNFLLTERSEENIDFYNLVEDFKQITNEQVRDSAFTTIYNLHVKDDVEAQANLPGTIKRKLDDANSNRPVTADVFNDAQEHVFDMLRNDSFGRFQAANSKKENLSQTANISQSVVGGSAKQAEASAPKSQSAKKSLLNAFKNAFHTENWHWPKFPHKDAKDTAYKDAASAHPASKTATEKAHHAGIGDKFKKELEHLSTEVEKIATKFKRKNK